MSDYIISVDVGQAQDPTALIGVDIRTAKEQEPSYVVNHICRFPLGTKYGAIVAYVGGLADAISGPMPTLVVDRTGVGRPVVEQFQESGGPWPIGITIHAGYNVTHDAGDINVPKRDLVAAASVVFENRRIKFAKGLAFVDVLIQELKGFRAKISAAGRDSYEAGGDWRSAPHDDLVLALAMALWYGEYTYNAGPAIIEIGSSNNDSGWETLTGDY